MLYVNRSITDLSISNAAVHIYYFARNNWKLRQRVVPFVTGALNTKETKKSRGVARTQSCLLGFLLGFAHTQFSPYAFPIEIKYSLYYSLSLCTQPHSGCDVLSMCGHVPCYTSIYSDCSVARLANVLKRAFAWDVVMNFRNVVFSLQTRNQDVMTANKAHKGTVNSRLGKLRLFYSQLATFRARYSSVI